MNSHIEFVKRFFISSVLILTFLLAGFGANAAYKIGDENSYLKIGGLLQTWVDFNESGSPDGDNMSTELYVRRMRLMFYGQINKWVNFFVETDNPKFGKDGDYEVNTFIQDAYMEFNLHKAVQVDVGMLLVPFSHHGMQGATSLLGLEYHSAMLKYPAGSNKVWRDFGVIVRGMPLGKWLDYRLGIFNGVHGDPDADDPDLRNPDDAPRVTARLTLNIFEPEGGAGVGGFFWDGIYLKKEGRSILSTKKVLSVGVSLDWQDGLNVPSAASVASGKNEIKDYLAFAGDVFWDIPIGTNRLMSVNGQINFYYYNHGEQGYTDSINTGV